MIPLAIQPWMIKGGAIMALLGMVFFGGCRVQKSMDLAKIQRIQANYSRAVDIIDTFQDNVDTLDMAIKGQNARISKLGEDHNARVAALRAANDAAITRLNTANDATEARYLRETTELRAQMVGLSVGEACRAAMEAIAQ
jgi:hypothetical protein